MNPSIIHRDIKPASILVAKETFVTKVCDMGLGKLKSAPKTAKVTVGGVPRTPSYMALECLIAKLSAPS